MVVGILRWIRFFLLFYLGLVALVALVQQRLIYFPARAAEDELVRTGALGGLEPWRTSEGELIGFYAPPSERSAESTVQKPVLVLHGNAGHAAHRSYYPPLFPDRAVYILEYPGFGARSGRPSEEAITRAAAEALHELTGGADNRASGAGDASSPPSASAVLLVGESIGGGPATALARDYPDLVDGILLITPFTRLADVARSQFPFLPVRILLRDRWDNVRNLQEYPGPVAILLAGEDRVVPARFGRELYKRYPGTARLWAVAGADHNTIIGDLGRETWRSVRAFLEEPRD